MLNHQHAMIQKAFFTLFLVLGLTIFIQELNMQSELSPLFADLRTIEMQIDSLPSNIDSVAMAADSAKTSLTVVVNHYYDLQERKAILWLSGCISLFSLLALLISFKGIDRPVHMIRLP